MTAYTSTVVARHQSALAVPFAATVGVFASLAASWWTGVLAAAMVLLAGWHLSVVRLSTGSGQLLVALGPCGRARRIPIADIARADAELIGTAATFSLTRRPTVRTTRLTIRPGPTLVLALGSGETIYISTADPAAAIDALHRSESPHTTERSTS